MQFQHISLSLFLWNILNFQANMDLPDDEDLDDLEQDEALLREIEELQLVNKCECVLRYHKLGGFKF